MVPEAGAAGILQTGKAPSIEDMLKGIRAPEVPAEIVALGKAGADLSGAATALALAAGLQKGTSDYLLAGLAMMFGVPQREAAA